MFKLCLHNNLNNKLYIYIFFFCLVRGGKSLHWSAPSRRLTVDTVPLSSMGKSVGNGLPVFIWSARRMENRIIILRNFASGSERMAAGVCGHPLLHRGNLRVWSGLPEKKRTCGPDQTAHVKGPLFAVLLFPRSSVWSQDRTATVRHRQSKVYVNPKSLY